MNNQHKAIRALLSTMSATRANEIIERYLEREDEIKVLKSCDICGLSLVETSRLMHSSPEKISKLRNSAYKKILDGAEMDKRMNKESLLD